MCLSSDAIKEFPAQDLDAVLEALYKNCSRSSPLDRNDRLEAAHLHVVHVFQQAWLSWKKRHEEVTDVQSSYIYIR